MAKIIFFKFLDFSKLFFKNRLVLRTVQFVVFLRAAATRRAIRSIFAARTFRVIQNIKRAAKDAAAIPAAEPRPKNVRWRTFLGLGVLKFEKVYR